MPDKERQSQYARNVITIFMERNRLTITTESRILGDEYVRFGGEYIETCSPKKGARRIVLSHWNRQDADNVHSGT